MSKNWAKTLSLFYGIFVLSFASYSDAFATEIDLISTTYLQLRDDARKNTLFTLRQSLDFHVIGYDGRLSLYSSGWYRLELDATENGDTKNNELLYAYLSYSVFPDRTLIMNLGRHFVFEGLASEQIDGASMRWEIWPMIGVSAFGGVPLETEFDDRESDYIFGGRLFLRLRQRAEVGFSYLKEDNDASSYREEIGIDVWTRPLKWLELQGESRWNNRTSGWIEHSYTSNVFPLEKLILSTSVAYTNYDDAFSPTTLSAFFPQFLGSGEELTKVGAVAEYTFNDWLSAVADYTRYEYDIQGSANFFGVALKGYFSDQGFATGAALHRMDGDTKRLRYLRVRLYATKTFEALEVSFDVVHLYYDKSFSGTNHAYSFSTALSYQFTSSLLASTSVYYSKNPDFDQEVITFLKIVYNFGKEI
ncbi:MAG: hypothetical protein OEU26_26280 [Candidatus Tectomicrobia bacterium]|nr:hypothetical protein [Candidatus Tectomicrobia bacterium]